MNLQILTKYRSDWTVNKLSCPFTFGEQRLKGELKKDSGNGWQAGITGSNEVSSLQGVPQLATICVLDSS